MEISMILIFVIGYLAIALEHVININKAAISLLMTAILWAMYACISPEAAPVQILHQLGEVSSIVCFIFGAMVIVELVDCYGGFSLTSSQIKRMNAVMQTCGFYDEAGEFSYLVGLPGKSGVGGGIAAIYPRRYSVAVWSPRLNSKGNSIMGMKALELLTTETMESIF